MCVCVTESLCRFSPYMSLTQRDKPSHSATNTHTHSLYVCACVCTASPVDHFHCYQHETDGAKGGTEWRARDRKTQKERERVTPCVSVIYFRRTLRTFSGSILCKYMLNGFLLAVYVCVYIDLTLIWQRVSEWHCIMSNHSQRPPLIVCFLNNVKKSDCLLQTG